MSNKSDNYSYIAFNIKYDEFIAGPMSIDELEIEITNYLVAIDRNESEIVVYKVSPVKFKIQKKYSIVEVK